MREPLLVVGAGGYLGRHMVQRLRRRFAVTALVRQKLGVAGVAEIVGDAPDPERLARRAELRGARVLHVAGSGAHTPEHLIMATNAGLTERVVACAQAVEARRLVYVAGYGPGRSTSTAYFLSKAMASEAVAASGLDHVVLDPSYVVGHGDGFLGNVLRQAGAGTVEIPGDGSYGLQPIWIEDMLAVLEAALVSAGPLACRLPVLGEAITIERFVRDVAALAGTAVHFRHIELAELIREAVVSPTPRLALTEIGILVASLVGPPTPLVLGAPVRGWDAVRVALADELREAA